MPIIQTAATELLKAGLSYVSERIGEKAFYYAKSKAVRYSYKTISDAYTPMTGQELLGYYSSDEPIIVSISGDHYMVPGTLVLQPIENGDLERQTVAFDLNPEKFKLPDSIAQYTDPVLERARKDKRLFDGEVVRLSAIVRESGSFRATLQLGSYYDAIATNFSMDHRPKKLSQSLRQYVHRHKSVGDFSSSPLVNHIGVVCMLETADGMLVAQQRSKNVANRSNSISSSASGTLEWRDICSRSGRDGIGMRDIAFGCLREVHRELGVAPNNVKYLGALRDYERGGMPDFYFFAKIETSLRKITDSHQNAEEKAESEYITGFEFHSNQLDCSDEQSRISFQKRVQSVLTKSSSKANLTFYAGTLLVADFLLKG